MTGPRRFAMRLALAVTDFIASEAIVTSMRLSRALMQAKRREVEAKCEREAKAQREKRHWN